MARATTENPRKPCRLDPLLIFESLDYSVSSPHFVFLLQLALVYTAHTFLQKTSLQRPPLRTMARTRGSFLQKGMSSID